MTTMNICLIYRLQNLTNPMAVSCGINWPLSHTVLCLKLIWRICTCHDVHEDAYLKVNLCCTSCWEGLIWITIIVFFLSFQCKRRFERDCKEADRAQQYFEKMDADINVTKADVEKVCVISVQSRRFVLYPLSLTQMPGFPHPITKHPPPSFFLLPFCFTFGPCQKDRKQRQSGHMFDARELCVNAAIVSAAQWSADKQSW